MLINTNVELQKIGVVALTPGKLRICQTLPEKQ